MFPKKAPEDFATQYTKLQELGRGQYGSVAKYRDNVTQAVVAIKEFEPGSKRRGGSSNEEMRILKAIRKRPTCHPNLACLVEYFGVGERNYIVSEFIAGMTMQDFTKLLKQKGQRVPPSIFKRVATGVLRALAFLHRRNIVHYDVKPDNIMLTGIEAGFRGPVLFPGGRAVLVDVGLACSVTCDPKRPCCAGIMVTPYPYVSPELVHHREGAKPRVEYSPELYKGNDVYAFGLCLYEMALARPNDVMRRLKVSAPSSYDGYDTGPGKDLVTLVREEGHRIVGEGFYPEKQRYEDIVQAMTIQSHKSRKSAGITEDLFNDDSRGIPKCDHNKPLLAFLKAKK